MATSNNRDVRLGIEIEATGEDSLKRLAAAVRSLSAEGDPAAAEYARLADELERLSQQSGAITALQALRADVEKLTASEVASTAAAAAATAAYAEQRAAAEGLRAAQADARAEVVKASGAYDELKKQLADETAQARAAGLSQQELRAAVLETTLTVNAQKLALQQRQDALTAVNTAVRDATRAETALRNEYDRTATSAQSIGKALEAQARALGLAETAAVKLGAETSDLARAQEVLLTASEAYRNEAKGQIAITQAQIDLDRQFASVKVETADQLVRSAEASRVYAAELQVLADAEQRAAQAQQQAKNDALAYVLGLEREAAAAIATAAELDRLGAAARKANVDTAYVRELTEALAAQERQARELADAQVKAAAAAQAVEEADAKAAIAARAFADAEARAIAEFNKAADAAATTRFWATEIDRLDAAAVAAAASQKRLAEAGEAVTKAFGQTGVRSLQAIRAEMNNVGTALTLLNRQYEVGAISAADLGRATSSAQVRLAQLRTELQSIPALPNVFEKINSSINDLVGRFGSLAAAVATFGFVVKPVLDADIAFETLRRTLTVVTGSAKTAAAQIQFLRDVANNSGLSVTGLSDSFTLFNASMLSSGQTLETTQSLFKGVANAAGTLGISTDRVNGILLGLGQIANKGKVSLEELQGQIGEALPGALKVAADSLGVTTAQLQTLLKEGKLLSDDFLPLFGRQLLKTFGEGQAPVEGLSQAFSRLKNAANETATKLVDTSAYKALTGALDALARNFDTVVSGFVSLGKAFAVFKAIDIAREFLGIKVAAELAASAKLKDAEAAGVQALAVGKAAVAVEAETVALNANTAALGRNAAASAAAAGGGALAALEVGFGKVATSAAGAVSKLGGFVAALGGPYGLALATAVTFSEQLGNGIAYVAAKLSGSIDTLKRNEEALNKQAESEKRAGEAAQKHAEVVAASTAKIQVEYDKQLAKDEQRIKLSELTIKAKKEEGDAATRLAELAGNEGRAKDLAAKAAGDNEIAIRSLLRAQLDEVTTLEANLKALQAAAGAEATWSETRRQSFKDSQAIIDKKKEEAEVTKGLADVQGVAADKAFQAAQANKLTGESLEGVKAAVIAATENYKALVAALKEGLTTQERVDSAARDLATAQGLLAKAFDVATAAITRRIAAQKEAASLAQSTIDVQRAEINANLKIAEATGQYSDKLQAQIHLKELDIRTSESKSAADNNEAKALREKAVLLEQSLKQGDADYEQKVRDVQALRNQATELTNKGEIERQNSRGLNVELGVLNGTLFQSAAGFHTLASEAEGATKKLDVFSDAAIKARKNADLSILGSNKYDKEKFALDSSGNRFTVNGQVNVPDGAVFDQAAFGRAQHASALSGNAAPNPADYFKQPAAGLLGGTSFGTDGSANGGRGTSPLGANRQAADAAAARASAPAPAPGSGSTQTVNIVINGTTKSIGVASSADAANLIALLTLLQDAANRTTQP